MAKEYAIAAEIAANNVDEQGAIEGYLKLLEVLEDPEDIAQIEEIIGDEKNHSHMLTKMILKYDGGVKEAED
jgi:rubrerythrin